MLGFGLSVVQLAVRKLLGSPAALFTTGVNGAWYDPSDINLTWRRNLLTYTEQFDNAAWGKLNATISANAVVAPDGTTTADKLVEDSTSNIHLAEQSVAAANSPYSFSMYLKAGERSWAGLRGVNASAQNVRAWFNLATGVVGTVESGGTASIIAIGNGWYRCTLVVTSANASAFEWRVFTALGDNSSVYTGDGTSGIYIWGAQLEVGSTATSYQRITDGIQDYLSYQAQPVLFQDAAGTTPVTAVGQPVGRILDKSGRGNHAYNGSGNSANFPVLQQDGTGRYYLAFNGVNQWLQTNSIDFTYGDKMFVSAGVRKLSDAALSAVAELSATSASNPGAWLLAAPRTPSTADYGFRSAGTALVDLLAPASYAAPIANVFSGTGNISSPSATLRVNGTQVAQSTASQGTGNFGNYPLYIGARGGAALWFNGRLYGLVVAGKQASSSEIASTEVWLNQKTGAY